MKAKSKAILAALIAAGLLTGCSSSSKQDQKALKAEKQEEQAREEQIRKEQEEKEKEEKKKEEARKEEEARKKAEAEKKKAEEEKKKQAEEQAKKEAEAKNEVDGIRAEFKEAVDGYVQFYRDYADFMSRYTQNPGDMSMLLEMADWISRVDEIDEKWSALEDSDEMSDQEALYIAQASVEINSILLGTLNELS